MKKILVLILLSLWSGAAFTQGGITLQGVTYRVDTLVHKHDVGLGANHTYFRLPDLPLQVSVLEIPAKNPYLSIESCLSYDTIRGIEPTSKMVARKSTPENYIFGAINGDFYNTSGVDKGLTVGGQLINGQVALVPHSSRPNVAFSGNNDLFLDVMKLQGEVVINNQTKLINGINKARGADQLILYNAYGGKTTDTNDFGVEVVVQPVSGEWSVNTPLLCRVESIADGEGNRLLEAGKAVLSGHGLAADFLRQVSVDQEITLNLKVQLANDVDAKPILTNSIGGDRIILSKGQVQENNWKELHPRSAIGRSLDGKKIILMVVEGRSSESIGVSTKQLAELMYQSGASDAFNLDGGGSSTLVIRGDVANVTSDGYERSVANSLLFSSLAPKGQAVKMQLSAQHMTIPFGQSKHIKASTFNEYGDVVDYLSATNVSYRIEGDIGTINSDGVFQATGNAEKGMIIGEWGNSSDTVHVRLTGIESLYFEPAQLTIDHLKTYKFKVFGLDINNNVIELDNKLIGFRSLSPHVGTVNDDGVFKGITDGQVVVEAYTLDEQLSAVCDINVEVAKGTVLLDGFQQPESWTTTSSWLNWVKLERGTWLNDHEEILKVSYQMTYQNRTASITLSRNFPIYSMPDSLALVATGNGVSSSIQLNIEHPSGACVVPRFSGQDMLKHRAPIDVTNIAQEYYPLSFNSIVLKVERNSSYTFGQNYEGSFFIKGLYATYPDKQIATDIGEFPQVNKRFTISPNPVIDDLVIGSQLVSEALEFELFNLNGQLVGVWNVAMDGVSRCTVNVSHLSPGLYIYKIRTSSSLETGKILKR
ncbi:phosphodiester glycosidase family protein [Carboxylicivirga taeanensis]|uniref:phosphodiester glycosidase family protein n=1 Tax=Carboxylicivirga taeanensis TaxID=1416875 RepID=UPI003F6DD80D